MKILIATPAYDGQIKTTYLNSIIGTQKELIQRGVNFSIYTISNESLIQRARNKCATLALEKGFDKLFFIDSDISWTFEDFYKIATSDKLVVGGTYPMKCLPPLLNYNLLDEHFTENFKKDVASLKTLKEKHGNEAGEVEVKHLPTGFMCIDTKVLKKLKDLVPFYKQFEPRTKEVLKFYDFFPVRVKDEILESEDWAFCSICREHDIPVYMNCDVITDHMGSHIYRGI